MGFGVPIDSWFRRDLKELAYDVIGGRGYSGRGILRPSAVRHLLDDHIVGGGAWHYQLWNVLMLELWFQAFIDERPRMASDVTSRIGQVVAA
jgi:asparagine synthase (glutamine-hydrolysing)